jgi:Leucine-rich repeat (LRR) protein
LLKATAFVACAKTMLNEHERQLIHAAVTKFPTAKALNLSNNGMCGMVLCWVRPFDANKKTWCVCTGLQSLHGLEALSDTLVKLDLSKNNLKLLRPLSSLQKLTDLSLEQNAM